MIPSIPDFNNLPLGDEGIIQEPGVSTRTRPLLALVTRFARPGVQLPVHFAPSPGVAVSFRYRRGDAKWSWAPSVDIVATALRFDPDQQFQLGIGGGIGVLRDIIHGGFGVNLMAGTSRGYAYLALDFIAGYQAFQFLTASAATDK